MVLQFVGFMGGWQHPQGLSPLLAATLGALLTTWATFTPCFLWIFLGGPYIEKLRGNIKLTTALSAITAAVVGVVLNLAVWFGMHFLPRVESIGSRSLFFSSHLLGCCGGDGKLFRLFLEARSPALPGNTSSGTDCRACLKSELSNQHTHR